MPLPEEILGLPMPTSFIVRFEVYEGRDDCEPGVFYLTDNPTLEMCQRRYLAERDRLNLGGSQFGDGIIFAAGKPVARISYNGRLWGPQEWTATMHPVAEAPPRTIDQARHDHGADLARPQRA